MKSKILLLASIGMLLAAIGSPTVASAKTPSQLASASCATGTFCEYSAPNYTGTVIVSYTCGTKTNTLTGTGSWIANEPTGDKVVFHFRNGTSRTYLTPTRVASFDWSSVLDFQIVC